MSAPELIIVRSLVDSDMGWFSEHRKAATSKQRALALTTRAARELLHPDLFDAGGHEFDCITLFGKPNREFRPVRQNGKNWRLGGKQLEDEAFARLNSKDFVLIRSVRRNDGSSPILIAFVDRTAQPLVQAGLVATFSRALHQSVAIFHEDVDSKEFGVLAGLFPSVPAGIAVRSMPAQPVLFAP